MTRPDGPGVCTCTALPPGHDDDQCAMELRRRTRCRCSHAQALHSHDHHGRPTCISMCGCPNYRPEGTK